MTRTSLRKLLESAWFVRASDWWRFAASFTRNDADADDLVDEAVVRTLRADPRLSTEDEVHAYVLTAIRNTWLRWSRGRRRRIVVFDKLRRQPQEYASSALQNLIEAEDQSRLQEAVSGVLHRMDPEIRTATELYLLSDPGLTFREIAEIQGTSTSTAHLRVEKALQMLAGELRELGDE